MDQKHGRWTEGGKVWEGDPEWNATTERWRFAGLEAQARVEMQAEIDRLKIEIESRIERGHAAMVLVLSGSFCLAVGFMAGWRLFG